MRSRRLRRRPSGGPADQLEGFAVGRDGTPIYFRTYGEGHDDAPPVILTDGIGCAGFIWPYIERALAERHQIVHWHYRGHGNSPRPKDPARLSVTDLADDLSAVGDHLKLRPGIVLGHSMGVQVALEFVRRYPSRVAGLVLMCGAYGYPLRSFHGQDLLEKAMPMVRLLGRFPGFRTFWKATLPTKLSYQIAAWAEVNDSLIAQSDFMPYLEHLGRVDPDLFLEMLAQAGRHTAEHVLEQISVPSLVVAGDRDNFTPPALSLEMHERIPGADLLVIEGGSHAAPLERPHLVASAVEQFTRRLTDA